MIAGTGCIPAEAGEEALSCIQAIEGCEGPIVAASDYMKVLPDGLSPWLPGRMVALGTDGFGRSDNREHLRRHFEVDAAEYRGGGALQTGARRPDG